VPKPAKPRRLDAVTRDLRSALEAELALELRRQGELHGPDDPLAEEGWDRWRVTISDPAEPKISLSFVIASREHELVLREWSMRGMGDPVSTKSRPPLGNYARVAGFALVDALEQGVEPRTYEIDAQGRVDHPYANGRAPHRRRAPRPTRPLEDKLIRRAAELYRRYFENGASSPTQSTADAIGYGDIAAITDAKTEQVLPQLGSVALQSGECAGKSIARHMSGEKTAPFKYRDKGTMATIGRGAAVVQMLGGRTMKGRKAQLAWGTVHLALLPTNEDRAKAVVSWAGAGLTHQRAGRITVRPDEEED
jgi:hypothetical protein